MAELKENAYQIKFKLIPKSAQYKSSFVQGLSFANSQSKAVELAKTKLSEVSALKEMDVEIKIQSVVKLRRDFLFVQQ